MSSTRSKGFTKVVLCPVEAALSKGNASARFSGLRGKLAEVWMDRCRLIRHEDQPAIKFDRQLTSSMFAESICFKTGWCQCQYGPAANVNASWMEKQVTDKMRPFFWSKGKDKERSASSARIWLEDARVAMSLHGQSKAGCDVEMFLHLGFVNFKTWKMTTLRLYRNTEAALPEDIVWLRVADLEEDDIENLLSCEPEKGPLLELLSDNVLQLREALKANLDLDVPYSAKFWKLSEAEVLRTQLPGFVEATLIDEIGELPCVWRGAAEEAVDRKRKRAPQPSGKTGWRVKRVGHVALDPRL